MKVLLRQSWIIAAAATTIYLVVSISHDNGSTTNFGTSTSSRVVVHAVSLPSSSFMTSDSTDESILLEEDMYTFEQLLSDFGRSYYDPIEYKARENIFYTNMRTIVQHNQLQTQLQQEPIESTLSSSSSSSFRGNYWMGINEFTDRQANELHRGYDKYQITILRTTSVAATTQQRHLIHSHPHPPIKENDTKLLEERLGITMEHVTELPMSVDWRIHGVTTPVKSQGQCGSCWAFASTAVLESHIALQTGYLYDLSPQELVSCATNPHHCGGKGGCTGATAEIAFDLVQQYGIVQEWQFGYQDSAGQIINCSLTTNEAAPSKDTNRTYFHGAVASISDYMVLPSNNYTVLMNIVAKHGPVAVSVACMPWHLYQSGIFYAPMSSDSTISTDLDHLVVLDGYGTDVDTGEDYWLVRNSWGPRCGEHGYIRLKRHSRNNEEEKECGYDTTPADGTACTFDPTTGKEIVPLPQKICGNSGILFDSAIPVGGYLL